MNITFELTGRGKAGLQFMAYCEKLPCLKAVLAGHMHEFIASTLDFGIPQYVAGAGYKSDVNLYTFV